MLARGETFQILLMLAGAGALVFVLDWIGRAKADALGKEATGSNGFAGGAAAEASRRGTHTETNQLIHPAIAQPEQLP